MEQLAPPAIQRRSSVRESTDQQTEQTLRSALVHQMTEPTLRQEQELELRQLEQVQVQGLGLEQEPQLQQLAFLQELREQRLLF